MLVEWHALISALRSVHLTEWLCLFRAKEASLSQAPQLPTVTEEEFQDVMFRERDENGQTELHILAAQSGNIESIDRDILLAITQLRFSWAAT